MTTLIETRHGMVPENELVRKTAIVERENDIACVRHWLRGDEVVRQDIEGAPAEKDSRGRVDTARGPIEWGAMEHELIETDEGDCIVAAVESKHKGELVRRSVWVAVKRTPSITLSEGKF